MSTFILMILQLLLLLAIAPIFDGMARKLRARYQSRIGPPIWQTYRDLYKLISRGRTHPSYANPLYVYTPYILFAIAASMFCVLPIMYGSDVNSAKFSDIFVLLYLGAFFRFVFAAAGVDSGDPFAGIGSSREAMIGIYVEPIVILSLCVIMFATGTSSLPMIKQIVQNGQYGYMVPSFAVASISFLWVMYIETGRKPYDLAEAEQELQEGLLSEFSGSDLALIQTSMMIKQFTMIGFFLILFEPWNFSNPFLAMIVFLLEAGALYVLGIFIDNFSPRFKISSSIKVSITAAFVISLVAVFLFIIGV